MIALHAKEPNFIGRELIVDGKELMVFKTNENNQPQDGYAVRLNGAQIKELIVDLIKTANKDAAEQGQSQMLKLIDLSKLPVPTTSFAIKDGKPSISE